MTIEIAVNGRSRAVSVERVGSAPHRFRVTWDGVSRLVDARRLDASTLSLILIDAGPRSHDVRVEAWDRGELAVYVRGDEVRATVNGSPTRFRADGGDASADGERRVVTPMPGKVVRLLVEPGAEVAARQPVAVVEAMKMENELVAPRAGRVKTVSAQEGASVEAGQVLVVIE